ncbi:MAG: fatty acid desaturase [Alphaproteobacteria bacterium]|nr:fatty acid desaturase [Alphaproteobacteria bacterium]
MLTAEVADTGRPDRVLVPTDLRRLSERSDLKGLIRFAIHLALIAGGAALVAWTRGTWWVLPAMFVQGWFLVALFAPVHESVHYTAFNSRWLNVVIGWIASVPTLINSSFYRLFHYAHHRHTQDPAKDPELAGPLPRTLRDYVVRISGWGYYRSRVDVYGRILRDDWQDFPYIPERERAGVRRSVAAMLAVFALVFAGWSWVDLAGPWLYWLVPLALAQPILRVMLLSEHTLCSDDDNGLTNTRTTLVSPLVHLVHWNMPYHAEHHLYPSIPFHRLPQTHREIGERFAHVAPNYFETQKQILRRIMGRP